jgi:hypothetical protein
MSEAADRAHHTPERVSRVLFRAFADMGLVDLQGPPRRVPPDARMPGPHAGTIPRTVREPARLVDLAAAAVIAGSRDAIQSACAVLEAGV